MVVYQVNQDYGYQIAAVAIEWKHQCWNCGWKCWLNTRVQGQWLRRMHVDYTANSWLKKANSSHHMRCQRKRVCIYEKRFKSVWAKKTSTRDRFLSSESVTFIHILRFRCRELHLRVAPPRVSDVKMPWSSLPATVSELSVTFHSLPYSVVQTSTERVIKQKSAVLRTDVNVCMWWV